MDEIRRHFETTVETIVCCGILQGNRIIPGFLKWVRNGFRNRPQCQVPICQCKKALSKRKVVFLQGSVHKPMSAEGTKTTSNMSIAKQARGIRPGIPARSTPKGYPPGIAPLDFFPQVGFKRAGGQRIRNPDLHSPTPGNPQKASINEPST